MLKKKKILADLYAHLRNTVLQYLLKVSEWASLPPTWVRDWENAVILKLRGVDIVNSITEEKNLLLIDKILADYV